ncbi:MAG TPA: hypothetical protein VFQ85_11015 [Mycobacteriales bacterium]|jgi:hypothetical protein|nr:hypothetical protein [Mycobacteriales bacterium]
MKVFAVTALPSALLAARALRRRLRPEAERTARLRVRARHITLWKVLRIPTDEIERLVRAADDPAVANDAAGARTDPYATPH